MIISTFLFLLLFIRFSDELNNGLGRTPQMGKGKKISFEEKSYAYFLLSKVGTVGIISNGISMKR